MNTARGHAHPQQREDRKPQHLTKREETVLQDRKQIHRRLHRAYAAPSSVDIATTDSVQSESPASPTFSTRTFRLAAACQPSSMLGSTATTSPRRADDAAALPRAASPGEKRGRVFASQAVTAIPKRRSVGAVSSDGAPEHSEHLNQHSRHAPPSSDQARRSADGTGTRIAPRPRADPRPRDRAVVRDPTRRRELRRIRSPERSATGAWAPQPPRMSRRPAHTTSTTA